jgi:OmpA-OmpF porin, OOP family
MNIKIKNYISIICMAFFSLNCASSTAYIDYPATASPSEEISRLKVDLDDAKVSHIHVLSPKNYEKAIDAYDDAVTSIERGRAPARSLRYISISRAHLQKSVDVAKVSMSNLQAALIARDAAIEARAPQLSERDFKNADDHLQKITRMIERNRLKMAQEDGALLQQKYLDAELDAIKKSTLGSTQEIVAVAKSEGAIKFAPQTLAKAERDIAVLDAFITANRHNKTEIDRRKKVVNQTVNHLLNITRESKSGLNVTSEEVALRMSRRDDDDRSKQRMLEHGEARLVNAESRNTELRSEQILSQRYETARKAFKSSEADVYKQGKTLVIRLKGLDFPVSKSTISPNNYDILSKLNNIVESFEGSMIIVEGHTDSIGSREANQLLSLNRAQAVGRYLASNSNGAKLNIKVIGYDFQRPLADNKTVSGRAQNRRVDVLITPIEE